MPSILLQNENNYRIGKINVYLGILLLFLSRAVYAQDPGSVLQFGTALTHETLAVPHSASYQGDTPSARIPPHYPPLRPRQFIVPGILFSYGLISLYSEDLKDWNAGMKEEIITDNPHQNTSVDNYLQFAPAAMVYGLHAIGIKGEHNLRDATMIYLTSNIILATSVTVIKRVTHEQRPNASDYYSFPSGHTAEAFASAEFLRQEYKDVSPWYGVAGYAMAAATGYLRMYNNEHWLGDVIAGAGVGMASTRLAYWLYPRLQHHIFRDKPMHTMVLPTYQDKAFGVAMAHSF